MPDITPNDIVNKEFHRTLRGYHTDEVDDFLQEVSDSLFHALEEQRRLRAQLDELRTQLKQYQQTEELMKNALMLAERTAGEVRTNAQHEAELIRREAEERLSRERDALTEVLQLRHRVIAELRGVLQAQLALLESQDQRLDAAATPRTGSEAR
jgi:cell division initiation protein